MISKYLGDCSVCGGNGREDIEPYDTCSTCQGTKKPVVVELVPIDVPEGYEYKGNITFGDLELAEFKKLSPTGSAYYVLHRKSPYKINSIDEYVCETCKGKGILPTGCLQTLTLWRYLTCPACKGKGKIDRKVIAITVEKAGCISCCIHKTDWSFGICDVTDCDDGCPLTKEEIAKAPKCKDCKGKDNFQFEIRRVRE